MSYARFSEGDVYVFPTGDGIECCACSLSDGPWTRWISSSEHDDWREHVADALRHLAQHQLAGDVVPESAIFHLEIELQTGVIE